MGKLSFIVESNWFKQFVFYCIVLNSITLIVDTSIHVSAFGAQLIHALEIAFMVIFILEAIIKILAMRKMYFKSGWNVFDFTIIVISSIPYATFFNSLRALRILRLFGQLPSVKKVVEALTLSIPGMVSTCLILLIVFVSFGIITTELFGADFPEQFGHLPMSLYSLFQVMTLESWSTDVVYPIMQVYPYTWVVFIPFILISSFILLNFIIGIIVDSISQFKNQSDQDSLQSQLTRVEQMLQELKDKQK